MEDVDFMYNFINSIIPYVYQWEELPHLPITDGIKAEVKDTGTV